MKTIFLIISLGLSFVTLNAQEKVQLALNFENITEKGNLMVAVFDSEEGWEKHQPIEATQHLTEKKSETVYFKIPKGIYGVAAFIDTNGNHFYDFGKEIYTFSNQYIPRENPTLEKFAIKVNQDEEITLKMTK
ncbi:MAG: DUF2141 domain-containing protein [Flavobacteriales bacterium]